VMRVVPFENEAVNECWIADRDRFSYEALNSNERLTRPMLKQGGQWIEVDWETALDYVVRGLKDITAEHGAQAIGALVSPHSTVEELYLAGALVRGLGSANIDYRLRHTEFETAQPGARWLGMPIAALSQLQSALVIGSNLRKDHPLFAQRIRQAARHGAQVAVITSPDLLTAPDAWALPLAAGAVVEPGLWVQELARVAAAVARARSAAEPITVEITPGAQATAQVLLAGECKAILLGNAAARHPQASSLLALAQWLGGQTGAAVGYLTEAANTVGAQLAGALPGPNGLNAAQMLAGGLKAALLFNCEPGPDTAQPGNLAGCDMVVTFSPFKANLDVSDVLLPIAPFTETSGTFVNAEGRAQSFHAVVKPLADTRPGWKVLRVLADLLGINQPAYQNSQEVLAQALGAGVTQIAPERLSNHTSAAIDDSPVQAALKPVGIYALDSIVRRAPALQKTADARAGATVLDGGVPA